MSTSTCGGVSRIPSHGKASMTPTHLSTIQLIRSRSANATSIPDKVADVNDDCEGDEGQRGRRTVNVHRCRGDRGWHCVQKMAKRTWCAKHPVQTRPLNGCTAALGRAPGDKLNGTTSATGQEVSWLCATRYRSGTQCGENIIRIAKWIQYNAEGGTGIGTFVQLQLNFSFSGDVIPLLPARWHHKIAFNYPFLRAVENIGSVSSSGSFILKGWLNVSGL